MSFLNFYKTSIKTNGQFKQSKVKWIKINGTWYPLIKGFKNDSRSN